MAKRRTYLKYYRTLKSYALRKTKLSSTDFDLLVFLHSEEYFTESKFDEFSLAINFNIGRFKNLLFDGWIEVFRDYEHGKAAIYTLTTRAESLIETFYDNIEGLKEPSTTDEGVLDLERGTDRGIHKMVNKMMADMRKEKRKNLRDDQIFKNL
jgi:hypothetical protein